MEKGVIQQWFVEIYHRESGMRLHLSMPEFELLRKTLAATSAVFPDIACGIDTNVLCIRKFTR